ncbi:MAG: c-type cytochrome, partial [Pseudomonadales bacterium]
VRAGGGEAHRGEAVFQRVCFACHNIGNRGKAFGPDLSDIGKRLSKEEIIKSIVWPSEEITKGYETVVVVTGDGKSISGFVIEEDENTLVLGVAEGKVQRFDKSDLEERKDMKASSMPEGLTKTIAPIEFLDLVEYLQVQKTPVEKASPSNQDDAHRVSP